VRPCLFCSAISILISRPSRSRIGPGSGASAEDPEMVGNPSYPQLGFPA
jgi:hypothetical protein